jgi:hypothetical protein
MKKQILKSVGKDLAFTEPDNKIYDSTVTMQNNTIKYPIFC